MKYAFFISEDLNLGAAYVIADLKSLEHEVKLFFDPRQFNRGYSRNKLLARMFSIEDHLIRGVIKYKPDIIMFSTVTATYGWALKLSKKIKKVLPNTPITFGGVHPTLCPEEVKRHKHINNIHEGHIENFNPDKIWPDRAIFFKELPPEHRRTQIFMTSFGCPFNCTFCGNEQMRKTGHYKKLQRKPGVCIDELEYLKDEYGMKYVLFVDDIFTVNKHFLHNFLPMYKERIGLPFACFVHPQCVDKEIVDMLKDAGCHTAWMGIQTGNEQIRKEILGRKETNKQIVDSAKLIKDAGIKLMVDHIFGIPYENNVTQDHSLLLYKEIMPDVVNCYQLLYFPKSKIIEHALKYGALTTGEVQKIERGEGLNYQVGNKGHNFYDTYVKGMCAIPLGDILFELLPLFLIKIIIHLRAGRAFIFRVVLQNELFFTWRMILKKLRLK